MLHLLKAFICCIFMYMLCSGKEAKPPLSSQGKPTLKDQPKVVPKRIVFSGVVKSIEKQRNTETPAQNLNHALDVRLGTS